MKQKFIAKPHRIVIIEGSSRSDGDMRKLTKYILETENWNFILATLYWNGGLLKQDLHCKY